MLKNNNIKYAFYIDGKLKLYPPLPSNTTKDEKNEVKHTMHDAASNMLKRKPCHSLSLRNHR